MSRIYKELSKLNDKTTPHLPKKDFKKAHCQKEYTDGKQKHEKVIDLISH